MKIALIADCYPPLRSSTAVQLRDLTEEFAQQGHSITMMVASPELEQGWKLEEWRGVQVLRLKTPKTKDMNYVRRTLGEFMMPYAMLRQLKKSPLADVQWDAIAWNAPTIFLAPMVEALKKKNNAPSYLIIRDIFPEWALDMGLMGPGLPYKFFSHIARRQYDAADVIGVQTPGNKEYFVEWQKKYPARKLEVLQNWLKPAANIGCSVDISRTHLSGRKIFVYAGNMGIAQGMDILLDLAEAMQNREDVGFVFVGRGSDAERLKETAKTKGLRNVLFHGEIDPDEIAGLYAQAHVGLVALDPRHKTHNIPGKFLSYMQSGLPVLAVVNPGNDLVDLVAERGVGITCVNRNLADVRQAAGDLMVRVDAGEPFSDRCKKLGRDLFSPEAAVRQIVHALEA